MNQKLKPIIAVAIAAILVSCDRNVVFKQNLSLDAQPWAAERPLSFAFFVEDTVSGHDMLFNVRNNNHYPYRNLYLFVEAQLPNGRKTIDTLECLLADDRGQWYGGGLGSHYDNRFRYKVNTHFPASGNYTLNVFQAMRDSLLPGITDVGLLIKKSE